MQAQSITRRTVTAASGMVLPATITPQTDFNLMVTAICLYHSFNEGRTDYDMLEEVKMTMRDGSTIVTLYTDAKGDQAARVLWPTRGRSHLQRQHTRLPIGQCGCSREAIRNAVRDLRGARGGGERALLHRGQ